jgi:hypothetical protein
LARVCRVLDAPRSTAHYRRRHRQLLTDGQVGERPGPAGLVGDEELVDLIRTVIRSSPFAGEGYRKIRARLRRDHQVHVSGKRVLRLLRREGLLAPQRAHRRRTKRLHEGTIVPAEPNLRWGTVGTLAWTIEDGWVWVFDLVDHHTCEAWAHVAKVGDRFAALQPVYDAVLERHASSPPMWPADSRSVTTGGRSTARPLHGSLAWLGITDSPAYPGEPECNGAPSGGSRPLPSG